MYSNRYERIKNFIRRAFAASATAFLCISGCCISNVASVQIHADTFTPGQKQSFVTWLMSYFGINIYTDAQQISDDLYTAVKLAYDAYLATLQPQQQIGFDDIADLVTWDNARPNVLKLPGTVYNVLKGFANYISSQVYDPSDVQGLEIGTFETIDGPGTYYSGYTSSNRLNFWDNWTCWADNDHVRFVFFFYNGYTQVVAVSDIPDCTASYSWVSNSYTTSVNSTDSRYSGYYFKQLTNSQLQKSKLKVNYIELGRSANVHDYIAYTFGASSSGGEATLNDVFALPQQGVLDDLIGAADPEDDMQLDLDGSDIAYGTASTLSEILDMIKDAVDDYVLDNSYPDTATKVIAQDIPIEDEFTVVEDPHAPDWRVPEPIATPEIIPLIQPECPDLSACLVAGIQDVGTSLGNVIESNSNVSNYVSVILFMGIALTILGGI